MSAGLGAGFFLAGFFAFEVAGAAAAFLDFIGLLTHGGLLPLYRIRISLNFDNHETGGRFFQCHSAELVVFIGMWGIFWGRRVFVEFKGSDGVFC